jgi:hypothetical protein
VPSPETYAKCNCKNCGGHIEFPSRGTGSTIKCPHCQGTTKLEPEPDHARGGRRRSFVLLSLVMAGVLAAGWVWWNFSKPFPSTAPEMPVAKTAPANTGNPIVKPVPPPPPVDPWNGFAPGPITLEKSGNGRLIYAIGKIRNETDRQRFGVKVEVELFDAQKTKVGSATDYAAWIDAHKEWNFKAMVTDKSAISAKLSKISEN